MTVPASPERSLRRVDLAQVLSYVTVTVNSVQPITVATLVSYPSTTTVRAGTFTQQATSTTSGVTFGQSNSATTARPLLAFALAPAAVALSTFLYVVL